MRFGCCLPSWGASAAGADWGALRGRLETLRSAGYDYAELSVRDIALLSDADFQICAREVRSAGLPVLAANSFIPAQLPVVGPQVDEGALRSFVDLALRRLGELGAERVVFGSGPARRSPDGFSPETARGQIAAFLRNCQEPAERYGIVIAIEPLNRSETNTILSVADGARLAAEVDRPRIRLLADSYHMYREGESYEVLRAAAPWLAHVHVANREERRHPGHLPTDGEDLRALFAALAGAGYGGGVSIECRFVDFESESAEALALLRRVQESV